MDSTASLPTFFASPFASPAPGTDTINMSSLSQKPRHKESQSLSRQSVEPTAFNAHVFDQLAMSVGIDPTSWTKKTHVPLPSTSHGESLGASAGSQTVSAGLAAGPCRPLSSSMSADQMLLPSPFPMPGLNTGKFDTASPRKVQSKGTPSSSSSTVRSTGRAKRPKRFVCPHCERVFNRHYNLKSHIRTHEDARPFVCTECNLTFVRNHDLTRHLKTHSDEKPHECSSCGRSFAR
jgi:predicted RNA-binding Zn-ribbon protein involved in translation (DUF1610 family)